MSDRWISWNENPGVSEDTAYGWIAKEDMPATSRREL